MVSSLLRHSSATRICAVISQVSPLVHAQPRKKKMFLWKILLPINIFLAVLFFGYLFVRMRYIFPAFKFSLMSQKIQCEGEGRATKNGDLFSIWTFDGKIAYEDIINATEDFNIKYCIGMGSCGSLYKAQLSSGKVVALKKLHSIEAHVPRYN
ncbi:hypothetical protein SO802_015178 [Lithocarpus litseifolius]|uniref:non-specific serine/threonine protein kinase n=1 Tax=Lithocarpus litseifolius TaxID=425828 RepID=A0AAW2CV98_9ROSI